jgi:hypothetical protein
MIAALWPAHKPSRLQPRDETKIAMSKTEMRQNSRRRPKDRRKGQADPRHYPPESVSVANVVSRRL